MLHKFAVIGNVTFIIWLVGICTTHILLSAILGLLSRPWNSTTEIIPLKSLILLTIYLFIRLQNINFINFLITLFKSILSKTNKNYIQTYQRRSTFSAIFYIYFSEY